VIRRVGVEVGNAEFELVIDSSHELPRVTLRRKVAATNVFVEVGRYLWLGDRLSGNDLTPAHRSSFEDAVSTELREMRG